ncbi:adenylyl-sulfate kinase [Cohnella boryungensis]|uniref:Adenylyl-sulfate kinase n=1 Tax=Cohnella boryungensis TaxID=768479 RepID=A0ABV8SGA2_9BACL
MTADGTVYWITGLAGAGKTTIGSQVYARLKSVKSNVVFLDGDVLREVFGHDLGYAPEDRKRSASRNSRLCKMLAEQGLDVVCATISLFHECHDWNRANLRQYREIYVRVPMEVLSARNQKGLYAGDEREERGHVWGIDLACELPRSPDLIVDNDGTSSPEEIAARIVTL